MAARAADLGFLRTLHRADVRGVWRAMTIPGLEPLPPDVWRPAMPPGFDAARIMLWVFLFVNIAGAVWNPYQAAARFRPGHVLALLWHYSAYPAAFASLEALALWWLSRRRPAGAILGAAIFCFHALRMLLEPVSPELAYRNQVEFAVGRVATGMIALLMLAGAFVLGRSARMLGRSSQSNVV